MAKRQTPGKPFARPAAAGALLMFWLASAGADAVNISYLDGKDPVAPDAITAYGTDLFGDSVNLFNGALEFEHTDLRVPGNNALPVALVRRHTSGQMPEIRGQFGSWDLQAPRIGGTFSIMNGWVTSSGGTNRCSGFSLPPTVTAVSGGFEGEQRRPGLPAPDALARDGSSTPSATGNTIIGFIASDYWRRTSIEVPGHGSQEVLKRSGTYSAAPADGKSYPLVTHNNWQISCLTTIQNGSGEGFSAVSPDGVRYRFDWMATRLQTDVKKSGARIGRKDFFLMATEVTDRHGNWVRYSYDGSNPWLLTRIESSDGRVITIANANGRATSASDGTRTYQYGYDSKGDLSSVVLPDGSQWGFSLAALIPPAGQELGESANCDFAGAYPNDLVSGTITHPSGATGTFTTVFAYFGRTQVERVCKYVPNSKTVTTGAVWPRFVASQALVRKQIAGPGLPALNWSFDYVAPGSWSTCTTTACTQDTRWVTVTEPTGSKTRHVFGNRWRVNEGQLLQVDEGWDGSAALRSTSYRYRTSTGQAFPDQFGSSLLQNSDWFSARHRPQDQRIVTLQGTSFTWQVDGSASGFDAFARPLLVRKVSSGGATRTELSQYHDNLTKWVLGQLGSLTEQSTGRVVEAHSYDAVSALRTASFSFGKQMQSFVYNGDGTLDTVKDAAGQPTRLTQHKRGKPQVVSYPDGTSESQSVNNLGNADWRTNAAGTTTSYQYDAMGRVARVLYPAESGFAYHTTEQAFAQVYQDEFGLAAGHWRQTISTGNARRIRYFDAMWRPRLELRYDVTAPDTTNSYTETRYDADGRKSFESYPERYFSSVGAARPGKATEYDAIDRVLVQRADSELGVLQTTTTYPANVYQRAVTNARGHTTTFAFQAFDSPSEDHITQIWAPEGVAVSIVRDLFGKPLSISRGGNGASATRSYAYDDYQRLCKTVEPESGATAQAYDLAGNLAWRASGLGLTSPTTCDHGSVPEARKISFGYDTRNRLTSTSYGDGSPGVSRSYTADGLPQTINTPSFGWTLYYNNRRLLVAEQLNNWQGSNTFGYGIDSHGSVASMSYPGGPTLQYYPDALGRSSQISGYLSGIWYHANGMLGGYATANGRPLSVSQNLRGLPTLWSHAGVVQDLYSYDTNGNVSAITDQQEGLTSRTMGYDALDRLTVANGIWGGGTFSYDTLDNLVASNVGGRALNHNINSSTNRLDSVSGSMNLGIGYDANGNIVQRGSQGFVFDIGNRMSVAYGVGSHTYDGLGRRSWTQMASGRTVLRAYSQAGRLLLTRDSQKGDTWHIHLGDKVVAETNSQTGTRWLHTDALGSPVAATGAGGVVLERTRYEPYGRTAAGTDPDGIGFTGHVNDVQTGLVYMQQRYYDPVAGRFLSVDPVVTDTKTGSSFNRFAYANNSPYAYTDPDGRQSWPVELNSNGQVVVTSSFGPRNTGIPGASTNHNGTDFRAHGGATIKSAQAGTIVDASGKEKGGNTIFVSNSDGSMNGYAHTALSPNLKVGDKVSEGQNIGQSDGSGTKQPHLHFTYMPGTNEKPATASTPTADPMKTQFKDKPADQVYIKGSSNESK